MNNEQDKHSMDEQVSATYREHSNERVPESLNRKILDRATREVGRSTTIEPLFGSWTKPLALAATVALSLAIVLEVTKLPDEVAAPAASRLPAAPVADSLREDFTPKDNSVMEAAQNQARLRDGSNRNDSLIAEPQAAVESELRRQAEDSPAKVAEVEVVEEVAEAENISRITPAATAIPHSTSEDMDQAKNVRFSEPESADVAAAERSTGLASSSFSIAQEKKESDAKAGCAANERESAKDWLACIEALRRSGALAEADSEYKEFILQFPAE